MEILKCFLSFRMPFILILKTTQSKVIIRLSLAETERPSQNWSDIIQVEMLKSRIEHLVPIFLFQLRVFYFQLTSMKLGEQIIYTR